MYLQFKRAFMAMCLFMTCMMAFAQRQVTGSVTDALGKPIIGVSVIVEGTTIGSVTDVNGNFTISRVPDGATLKISYIGYLEQTIKVGPQSNYYVTLHEDNQNLDELVVIGYQTVKKRDLTGAVSSIKEEDITNVASANALVSMQGKIPGLSMSQSSGEAGSGVSINMRGYRSLLASNDPLVIVDGVEYGSDIDINPYEIESIDVLRDASSTAIYGTRGSNGVIIITTKHGQAGKTHVNLNVYNSWNSATNFPRAFYGDAEVKWRQEKESYQDNYKTYENSDQWGTTLKTAEEVLGTMSLPDGTTLASIYNDKSYVDWIDELLRNNTSQNYELGIDGGSEKTNFSINLGMLNDRGLMAHDELHRYTGKANIDHKVNDYFKFGASLFYSYEDRDRQNGGVYNQSLKMTSITHAYDVNGDIVKNPNLWYPAHANPLLDRDGNYQNNTRATRFFGNAYGEINILRNLSFRTMLAYDNYQSKQGLYQDYESVSRFQSPTTTYIRLVKTNRDKITWDNTLKYNTDFGASSHNLDVLLGHELIKTVTDGSQTAGTAGAVHYRESSFYDLSVITSPVATYDNPYIKSSMLSFFGRVNYTYAEKYLLTASLRSDGSSVLAEGHKWAAFPSVAAGWRVIEEPWMISTSSWLSNLKLRASWGVAGNSAIAAYQTIGALSDYYVTYNDYRGKIQSSMSNPNLTWEKTTTFDVGLDFGFLNGRINGNIDFYWSKTKDLLYYDKAPTSSVFSEIISNVGNTKGSGIEVALDADVISARNFNWNANITYTHCIDEVESLSGDLTLSQVGTGQQYFSVGQRVMTYYDYKADNTWAIGEYEKYVADWESRHPGETANYNSQFAHYGDPGTPKIVDVNDDGKIDTDDRIFYDMAPDHVFGMTNTFTYKDFSLSCLLYASLGGYMQYALGSMIMYDGATWPEVDYWTVDNQHAKFPSPGLTSEQQSIYSTYSTALRYEKADYIKIKDITLGYNLPTEWIRHLSMAKCKVYASMKNFITISDVDNYDPERGGAITFPMQKQFVIGLNVEF